MAAVTIQIASIALLSTVWVYLMALFWRRVLVQGGHFWLNDFEFSIFEDGHSPRRQSEMTKAPSMRAGMVSYSTTSRNSSFHRVIRLAMMPPRSFLRSLRAKKIKSYQQELLKVAYPFNTHSLIVVMAPGGDGIGGGVLAETGFYEETRRLKHVHGAETIMCIVPGEPGLLRYSKFVNQIYLYDFHQLLTYFRGLESLIIHVPEYAVFSVLKELSEGDYAKLRRIQKLHLNILIQNLEMFECRVNEPTIETMKKLGKLTCTAAHERYSTQQLRNRMGFPMHKLSDYVTPELYVAKNYAEKEDIMIVSPDLHLKKSEILAKISNRFPRLRLQVVQGLSYEEYKELISRAKWALTFGEGLDGYFVETIFSGGVSFAVYNSTYFSEDFRSLRTVYPSYDSLLEKICLDLEQLDAETPYNEYHQQEFELCHKYYRHENYAKNVELFYREDYTFK